MKTIMPKETPSGKPSITTYKWFLGFGIAWGIEFNCFSTNTLFAIEGFQRAQNDVFNIAMLSTLIVTSLAIALLSMKGILKPLEIPFRPAVASSLVGLLIIMLVPPSVPYRQSVLALAGVFSGLGFGLLTIAWQEHFAYMDPSTAATNIALAYLLGAIVCSVLSYLPFVVAAIVALCSVALSCYMLKRAQQPRLPFDRPVSGSLRKTFLIIILSLLCTVVLQMLFTAVSQIAFQSSYGFEETNLLINVAMVGSSVFFCVVVLLTARKPSPTSVYDVIFLLIGSALLLLPFLGAEYGLALGIVVIVCTHFVSSAFLVVAAHAIHTQKANAYVVFGITEAAIRFFSLLGVLLGTLIFKFGSGFTQLTVFSFAGIYLLGMVLVVVLRRSKREKALADYMEEPDNRNQPGLDIHLISIDDNNIAAGVSAESIFRDRCMNLAKQYNLTAREEEVLFYLVQGHTIARISGELFITANTVKTHVKMIHAKLDVHSKQELLDLFHESEKNE